MRRLKLGIISLLCLSFIEANISNTGAVSQPLGIYLPHDYDTNKTYKTIYLAHGGGGNDVEWMNIASATIWII